MADARFASTPEPPYVAVIFSSQRTPGDQGYAETAARMEALVAAQPGFLGMESTRDASGFGITAAYFRTLADVAAWKTNAEHQAAQREGHARWYVHFEIRVAEVTRAYGGPGERHR